MNTKIDDLKIKIGLIICQTKMKYENSKNSYKVQKCTKSYKIVQIRTNSYENVTSYFSRQINRFLF